ncbi:MAG: MBL fold metallo-hydrolase [Deltaproteobacteria bacterium]|nr:MBL fold metallo-hydrolase [Deltaproteobacteria bacterium]
MIPSFSESAGVGFSMGIGFEEIDYIHELAANFYFVQGDGRGLFPYCNGYLLTGEETVLIDTGIGEGKIREIDKKSRIDVVIITHSHPDHIRNWDLLKDRHLLLRFMTLSFSAKDLQVHWRAVQDGSKSLAADWGFSR